MYTLGRRTAFRRFQSYMSSHIFIYILLLPAVTLTFIFAYLPLPGIIVAFQKYKPLLGTKSPWIVLGNFQRLFTTPKLTDAVWTTLYMGVLTLLVGFPLPIILALLLNELRGRVFKRSIQTISYLPYFLSWISIIGIFYSMFSKYGPINDISLWLKGGTGADRVLFLSKQELFMTYMLLLVVWKNTGWNSVIYLAAISSVDEQLYEAARIDGAGHFQQMIHITLASILPTIIIMLIFNMGGLIASNFELVYGLQNAFLNTENIQTIVYKYGIAQGDYSMGAAIGLFEGVMAFLLTFTANRVSKWISGVGIW